MRGIDAIPIEYAYAGYFPATNFDVFIERRDRAMSIESPRVCSCIDVRFADINIYIHAYTESSNHRRLFIFYYRCNSVR